MINVQAVTKCSMMLCGVTCQPVCASPSDIACKETKEYICEYALKIALTRSIFQHKMHYM